MACMKSTVAKYVTKFWAADANTYGAHKMQVCPRKEPNENRPRSRVFCWKTSENGRLYKLPTGRETPRSLGVWGRTRPHKKVAGKWGGEREESSHHSPGFIATWTLHDLCQRATPCLSLLHFITTTNHTRGCQALRPDVISNKATKDREHVADNMARERTTHRGTRWSCVRFRTLHLK